MNIKKLWLILLLCSCTMNKEPHTKSQYSQISTNFKITQLKELETAQEKVLLAQKVFKGNSDLDTKTIIHEAFIAELKKPTTEESDRITYANFILSHSPSPEMRKTILDFLTTHLETAFIGEKERIKLGKYILDNDSSGYKNQTLKFFTKRLKDYSLSSVYKNTYINLILKYDNGTYAKQAKDYYTGTKEHSLFDKFAKNIEKPQHS